MQNRSRLPTPGFGSARFRRTRRATARSARPVGYRSLEVDAEELPELAQHDARIRIVAPRQDRARKVVERFERTRRVEIVVDRVAYASREEARVGTGGQRGRGQQAPQQGGSLFEIGVVPLETVAVVVPHERE